MIEDKIKIMPVHEYELKGIGRKELTRMNSEELASYIYYNFICGEKMTEEEKELALGTMMASVRKMRVMTMTKQQRSTQLKKRKENKMKKEAYERMLNTPQLQVGEMVV